MNLQEAIKKIVDNWEDIKDAQVKGPYHHWPAELIAVWCAYSDTAGSYEVDEEWIGITPQGKIAWAYASGCSCWDGDFSTERFASMKEVILTHEHAPEDWEKAIIKFSETNVLQEL